MFHLLALSGRILVMKIAVISDIHGNWEALEAVLKDIEELTVEEILCIGDAVGYGADPELVIKEIRKRSIPCILGNHELGLRDPSMLEWFNLPTQESLLITRRLVSEETMNYISTLEASMTAHGALLVHGAPPDSVTTYLFELGQRDLLKIFESMEQPICFVGHTHQLELIGFDGEGLEFYPLKGGIYPLRKGWKYIVNVGSVGQPRDGDNRAKYVVWSPRDATLEVRHVRYDIAKAAAKILERGFPPFNATRLW